MYLNCISSSHLPKKHNLNTYRYFLYTRLVEDDGIEPTTLCLQSRCSTKWANPPLLHLYCVITLLMYYSYTSSHYSLSNRKITFKLTFFFCLYDLYHNRKIECLLIWWVWLDLNQRPHAYQACALTSWATNPYGLARISILFLLTNNQ